jgi:ABC-type branched-subunit amino acid transport system permease subunit
MLGPFLGAGLILGLRNWVSTFFELHLAVMGLVFIAVVIWAPGGVMGVWQRLKTSRRERS